MVAFNGQKSVVKDLFTVLTVKEAQERILKSVREFRPGREKIPVDSSLGRVLAEDIISPETVPSFHRSTMDGFAVHSGDTFGASESLPALLNITGEVLMGREPPGRVNPGEAMGVPTGGMIPEGCDSVVMVEHCDVLGDQVAIYRPVAPYENIVRAGDDLKAGDLVLPAGHLLRPQDIGLLAALGILEIEVYSRPRVIIFSTGDELVHPGEIPKRGQIRDVNGLALAALVRACNGLPLYRGIIPDNQELLKEALLGSLGHACVILVSGGSSVGMRDITARALDELPGDGVLFHGVSMRPGKPLIYGVSRGVPIFGLSGNPVSAMFGFLLFVRPLLRYYQGLPPFPSFQPYVEAFLKTNYSSPGGREDYVRVILAKERDKNKGGEEQIWATPLFGGPALLYTVVKGDGYFVIPRDVEGLERGSRVKVFLF